MNRIQVQSSMVRALAYDPATQTLELVFTLSKKRQVYPVERWSPVTQSEYETIVASESIGKALHALKSSVTRFERCPDEPVEQTEEVAS